MNIYCSQYGGCWDEEKLISTSIETYFLCCYCFSSFLVVNIWLKLELEPEPKLRGEKEPQQKINNFGSATLNKPTAFLKLKF